MATATKAKPLILTARVANLRVVVLPDVGKEKDVQGRVINPGQKGIALEFENHRCEVDEEFANRAGFGSIDAFKAAMWEAHDEGLTGDWRQDFNTTYWMEGEAPDEPKPTLAEQTKAIAQLSATRDVEGLGLIIEIEEGTHNREPVLLGAREAIETIEAAQEAVPEEEEPQAPEGAEEGSQ